MLPIQYKDYQLATLWAHNILKMSRVAAGEHFLSPRAVESFDLDRCIADGSCDVGDIRRHLEAVKQSLRSNQPASEDLAPSMIALLYSSSKTVRLLALDAILVACQASEDAARSFLKGNIVGIISETLRSGNFCYVEHFISILAYMVSIDASVFAQIPITVARTLSLRSELASVAFARLLFNAGSDLEQGILFESISMFYALEFTETYPTFCWAVARLSELDLALFLQFALDDFLRECTNDRRSHTVGPSYVVFTRLCEQNYILSVHRNRLLRDVNRASKPYRAESALLAIAALLCCSDDDVEMLGKLENWRDFLESFESFAFPVRAAACSVFATMFPRMADFGSVIEILELGAMDVLVEGLQSTDDKGTIDAVLSAICDVASRSRAEGTIEWLAETLAALEADFAPEVIAQIRHDEWFDILVELLDLTDT